MSKEAFDALDPARQETVTEAAKAAAESGRQAQLASEEELVSFLEEQGLEIYEPDVAAFREHVQGEYEGSEFAEGLARGRARAHQRARLRLTIARPRPDKV